MPEPIFLAGDDVGRMNISPEGIIHRDALVFRYALERHIPLAMVLSGEYTPQSARVIGESIENIFNNVIN